MEALHPLFNSPLFPSAQGNVEGNQVPESGPSQLIAGDQSPRSEQAGGNGGYIATPPVESSGQEPEDRVLLTGIDTLDFGLYVEFAASFRRVAARLEQYKRQARKGKSILLADGRCQVLPSGKPNYPFHVQFPGFQLFFSRKPRPEGESPNVYISLNSEFLWQHGVRSAVAQARAAVLEFAAGNIRELRISRCDLCVDVLIPGGVSHGFVRTHIIARCRKQRVFSDGDQMETLYVGAPGAEIQLRIYDKSREIAHSGKTWFLPLWGLQENANVWRFEFQIGRDAWKAWKVNSLDDLLNKAGLVWRYLTLEWCAFRIPDDGNVTRCTIHPLWALIQSCDEKFGPLLAECRRIRRHLNVDVGPVIKQIAGHIVGYAARRGHGTLKESLDELIPALEAEFQERDFLKACQRKAIELGRQNRKDAA